MTSEPELPTEVPPKVPSTLDALFQIIDVLWGELPVEVTLDLAKRCPEIVDACRLIHEQVNHT